MVKKQITFSDGDNSLLYDITDELCENTAISDLSLFYRHVMPLWNTFKTGSYELMDWKRSLVAVKRDNRYQYTVTGNQAQLKIENSRGNIEFSHENVSSNTVRGSRGVVAGVEGREESYGAKDHYGCAYVNSIKIVVTIRVRRNSHTI